MVLGFADVDLALLVLCSLWCCAVQVDIQSSGRTPVAVFDYELELAAETTAKADSGHGGASATHGESVPIQLRSSWLYGVECSAV
jgi:hypothetical protein